MVEHPWNGSFFFKYQSIKYITKSTTFPLKKERLWTKSWDVRHFDSYLQLYIHIWSYMLKNFTQLGNFFSLGGGLCWRLAGLHDGELRRGTDALGGEGLGKPLRWGYRRRLQRGSCWGRVKPREVGEVGLGNLGSWLTICRFPKSWDP